MVGCKLKRVIANNLNNLEHCDLKDVYLNLEQNSKGVSKYVNLKMRKFKKLILVLIKI